jgi:hypothetical protein
MTAIGGSQLFPGNGNVRQWRGKIPAGEIGPIARRAAQNGGFSNIKISRMGDHAGELSAAKQIPFAAIKSGSRQIQLQVLWRVQGTQHNAVIEWFGYSQLQSGQQAPDSPSMELFGHRLVQQIRFWEEVSEPRDPIPDNPVVAPGDKVPQRYTGEIRDYSRFLPEKKLAAVERGVLPLGTAAFGWEPNVHRGSPLFMPTIDGVPAEQFGVLLCAPSGSGKTHLLARWAAAAAMNGASVFALDVKGTLRSVLEQQFRRAGASIEIREFTTDAGLSSDRCNFLAGLRADDPECATQLSLLAEALLPKQEGKFWEDVARNTLKAVLKLGKLVEWHDPALFAGGAMDLTHLLPVVQSERELRKWLKFVYQMEAWDQSRPAKITAEECGHALSHAIDRTWALRLSEDEESKEKEDEDENVLLSGQRPAEHTFQQYTLAVQQALEPYRGNGTVGPRVSSSGAGQEIRLDRIGELGPPNVTIFTAPESGDTSGRAILTMVLRRLRHHIDKRRLRPKGDFGELLILLDETARIQGFDPADFASISRDNRVGYMFVYQTLSFIQPIERLHALMRNIGTQIYLKQITGPDLQLFNGQFYDPKTVQIGTSKTQASDSATMTKSEHFARSQFLEAVAAIDLPGGRRPAVIYIRDLKAPFIVDLHVDEGATSKPQSQTLGGVIARRV